MQLLKFKIDLLTFTIAHTSISCPLFLVLFFIWLLSSPAQPLTAAYHFRHALRRVHEEYQKDLQSAVG